MTAVPPPSAGWPGPRLAPSTTLAAIPSDPRAPLARRADELDRAGQRVLRIGGDGSGGGLRLPEELRAAVAAGLTQAAPYCHQQGLPEAREAVAAWQRGRGVAQAAAELVFIGNGASELVMLALCALLEPGDQLLVPAPGEPLWAAAAALAGATAVHYPCLEERGFVPDAEHLRRLITPRTRALVVGDPNDPTGAVYPRAALAALAALAEEHGLAVFADETHDRILHDGAEHVPLASLVGRTLCGTLGGLSKACRGAGLRVGWLSFSGTTGLAGDYLRALDLLACLRLCPNLPGQFAVPVALGDGAPIEAETRPGGWLHRSREALLACVARSRFLTAQAPQGALSAWVRIRAGSLPGFDDQVFARELLERQRVLVAPGSAFAAADREHFRVSLLPGPDALDRAFARIEVLLDVWMRHGGAATAPA